VPLPFGKSKENRNLDVDRVVKKLKDLYRRYSEQYDPKLFNLRGFEERYRKALRNKLNLNAFLHAEITVFEELKKKVEVKLSPQQKKPTYSEIADKIIEKNLEKIKKYRQIDFYPDAEEETKYLLGCVTDFYNKFWGNIHKLLKITRLKRITDFLNKLENDFSYYVVPMRGLYSRAVDDYTLILSRKNPRDSEKASVNFIKYGGILLNNCLKVINDGLNFLAGAPEYKGKSIELQRYREILIRIIDDFRLSDIRGY
jgi:hypothetical protein